MVVKKKVAKGEINLVGRRALTSWHSRHLHLLSALQQLSPASSSRLSSPPLLTPFTAVRNDTQRNQTNNTDLLPRRALGRRGLSLAGMCRLSSIYEMHATNKSNTMISSDKIRCSVWSRSYCRKARYSFLFLNVCHFRRHFFSVVTAHASSVMNASNPQGGHGQ